MTRANNKQSSGTEMSCSRGNIVPSSSQRSSSLETNASSTAVCQSAEADKFEVFERWLRDNGARFPLLELRKYSSKKSSPGGDVESDEGVRDGRLSTEEDDGAEEKKESGAASKQEERQGEDDEDDGSEEMRGVHAKATIPPQTVCVSIPKACLITVEMGQATPVGRKILASDLELDAPKHIFLMIYLLWDRKMHGRHSFFAPYYDILPKKLRNMPIFWTPDELAYLAGSHLLAQIADRAEAIADDYASICNIAPEFKDLATLEEFQWARMIVCSRNFGLLINGHRTSALVPHADMLNHYRPRETKWTFDDETQCFTITTLQTIGMGDQVYDSYGQKCNHRFLLNYGFAVEDNREVDGFCPNEVPLELSVDCGKDDCWEKKLAFWTRGDVPSGMTIGGGVGGSNLSTSFQALAAAVAGASSTSINNAVTAIADATTTSSIIEASMPPPAPRSSASPIKRVRVCVSNNENTRILFSMLRVLACNAAELEQITWGGRLQHAPSHTPGHSQFYVDTNSPAHRLFGVAPGNATAPSPTPVSLRSCRDIRYPINLHNERRAMDILLEVTGRALAKYPTSLAQDTTDLLDEHAYPRFSNKRHAKLQVRGEKEVLHHFALWARTAIHVIDIILHELSAEKRLGSSGGLGGSMTAGILCTGNLAEYGSPSGNRNNEELGYDYVIQAMEDDDDCHSTILRYCSDVLGAVRRDELNRISSEAIRAKNNGSWNRP